MTLSVALHVPHMLAYTLQTLQEDLTGAAFHPLDDNLLITHGKGHLTFWTRRKDGFFERTDIIKPVSCTAQPACNIQHSCVTLRYETKHCSGVDP